MTQSFLQCGALGLRVAMGAAVILAAGCASPEADRPRAEVMDLNDSPPVAPTPPTMTADPLERASIPPTPAAPPAMPIEPAGGQMHTVAAKDTLYSLAQKYYGDAKQWTRIRDANPGVVPERMPVGKAIVIP